ncbi:MAG: hypothetical protein KBD15_02340 [Candidatus Magasanikbacteria bacterium]|jgi:membrane protein YqaA with SNARE-associated domain|nr:hypothetical protein [Candidatus Magasanikbacteria bacterium]
MMQARNTTVFRMGVKIIFILLLIALVVWLNTLAFHLPSLDGYAKQFGYAGLFVVSFLSGFNIFIPIPVAAFMPSLLSLGFAPLLIVLTISLGMTCGDIVGYIIGRGGRHVFKKKSTKHQGMQRMLERIEILQEKHPSLPYIFLFFFVTFVPLPNELVVIPFGFLRLKFLYTILAVLLGNLLFNAYVAIGFTQIPLLF